MKPKLRYQEPKLSQAVTHPTGKLSPQPATKYLPTCKGCKKNTTPFPLSYITVPPNPISRSGVPSSLTPQVISEIKLDSYIAGAIS